MVETIYDAPRTRLIRHSSREKNTKTKLRPQLRWGGIRWGVVILFNVTRTDFPHI